LFSPLHGGGFTDCLEFGNALEEDALQGNKGGIVWRKVRHLLHLCEGGAECFDSLSADLMRHWALVI
jgi:hypothetical protein